MTGNKGNRLIQVIKSELWIVSGISLGIFLFILFFQPFPIELGDFNNSLLTIAGLGVIVFLILMMSRIVCFFNAKEKLVQNHNDITLSYLHGFLVIVLCSVAFAFYLRYVANIPLNFYFIFKVILICFVPPLVLRLYYLYKHLSFQINMLENEKENLIIQLKTSRWNNLNKKIEFFADNNQDNLILLPKDIICLRSADNYVEIVYKEKELFKKKLIRNTLRNIEQMLKPWSVFVRCHRTCIVNTLLVQNLYKKNNNYLIKIRGYDEEIHVSRQQLFRLKEALDRDQGRIEFTDNE